jgi:RHS repeat-associated protein
VGTAVGRRLFVAIASAILIFEAGAVSPASSVSAAPGRLGSAGREAGNTAPVDPPAEPPVPDATSVTCDDFNRTVTDGLGAGALGVWQTWNGTNEPPGMTHVSGGEASLISHSYGGTIRYLDLGSVPPPFEIYLKQRVWLGSAPGNNDEAPISIYFGLSTTPAFDGTIPPADYYVGRYYHLGDTDTSGRWVDDYPRARVNNQTGYTNGPDTRTLDQAYADGTTFYTRMRVFSGNQVYIKDWFGSTEPTTFFEVPIVNPSVAPMRFLVIQNDSSYPLPATTEGEWRIDDLCVDTAPPPVLHSESIPPETDHNHHPNGETGGDPVNTFNGSLTQTREDLAIQGRGPIVGFKRTYNSNDPRIGPMGPGWTHNYASRLVLADDASGDMYFIGPQGRSDRYTLGPGGTFTPPPGIHAQLIANPDGTFTVANQDQSSWTFDVGGRLTSMRDRYGNVSTLGYGAGGRLTSVSDPAGRGSLTFAYTNGLLTSLTDWASPARVVTYQYDGTGRLWKVTDREGKTTTYTYDGTSQRIATITDARNHVALTLTYDASGRVQTQKDARGLTTGDTTSFGYVVNGDGTRVTTVTSPPTSFEPGFNPTLIDTYSAAGWITQRVSHPSSTETLTEAYTYDANGNRDSVTNPRGNTTNFCYDVDYSGAIISGNHGNLTRLIAPPSIPGANRPVTLTAYDSKDNPIQIVMPKGVPSGTTVTCSTNLSAININFATDSTYDANQILLLSQTNRYTDPELGALTAVTKYEYTDSGNPGLITKIIPPRGNTGPSPDYTYATTFAYFGTGSKAGLLSSTTDPLGNITTYDYDSVGRRISSVDAVGNAVGGVPADHRTDYVYDKEDRIRFVKLPAPAGGNQLVSEIRYDEVGNPTVQIDANGQVTTRTYDERDALSQLKESANTWSDPASPPAGVITTEYAYDAAGNRTRMTRAKSDATYERATDYAYDGRHLVRRETQYPSWPSTSGPLVASTSYDPSGNRATFVDQLGRTTTFGYDALERQTSIDYSDVGTPDASFVYDANGNRTQMVDGTGTTTYVYDELNRLTSTTSPGPKTVGYRYDRDGNRTKLIYPDATAVTYTFNKASQLGSLTDWAARSVSYTYWPDGLVKTATNPDGSVESHAYDNARRLVDIVHTTAASAPIDRFYYSLDAVGNVTTVANGSLQTQFARPDGLTGSNGTWTGTYASIGEAVANDADFLASPSGPTSTNYYEVSLSDSQVPYTRTGIVVRYRYAKSGNNSGQTINLTVELRQGSTVIASQTQNNIPGVSGSGWQQGTITLTPAQGSSISNFADLRIRFSPVGTGSGQKRSAQVSWAESQFASAGDPATQFTYTYDRLYRLTAVAGPDGPRSYTYDPVGNRLSKVAGASTAYTYDRADRITSAGASSTTVDANGNLTATGLDTFTFDQANRMTVATVGGAGEAYLNDGDGVRFSRQIGANPAIRYVSDVNVPLPLTIDDGTRKYVYGLGLAFNVAGASLEIYHADRLGSVRVITNGSGSVTASYRSDEYGLTTVSTGSSSQPFGYTGEPRDSTNLSYLRARYYDPSLGRFNGRDKIWGRLLSSLTLNRYAYVLENPATYRDRSGKGTGGLCVEVVISVWGAGFTAQGCVVASTKGQVGVTGSVGGGGAVGPVPVSASLGGVVQVSNADYIQDLAGPFYNVGGSEGAGLGVQGSGFWGKNQCGQDIWGGTVGGQFTTPQAGGYGIGTGSAVVPLLGDDRPACSLGKSQVLQ